MKNVLDKIHDNPIDALRTAIKWVNDNVDPHELFFMNSFSECVIGVMNNRDDWGNYEKQIINEFFGIKLEQPYHFRAPYFGTQGEHYFKPQDWEVIRLFTKWVAIGSKYHSIQATFWLDEAYKTLKKLESAQ